MPFFRKNFSVYGNTHSYNDRRVGSNLVWDIDVKVDTGRVATKVGDLLQRGSRGQSRRDEMGETWNLHCAVVISCSLFEI